jgi:5-methylcytosine-specific restriction endonuclease McrA
MDKRRIFSARQRKYIYFRADGKCEDCGIFLDKEWHAHHVDRYVDGGVTEIQNGVALCIPCHHQTHSKGRKQ